MADGDLKEESREEIPPEPEPPNPFSQLTDQELEEYKKEVERKKLGLDGKYPTRNLQQAGGGLKLISTLAPNTSFGHLGWVGHRPFCISIYKSIK